MTAPLDQCVLERIGIQAVFNQIIGTGNAEERKVSNDVEIIGEFGRWVGRTSGSMLGTEVAGRELSAEQLAAMQNLNGGNFSLGLEALSPGSGELGAAGVRPGGAFMGFQPQLQEVLKAAGRADQAAMRNIQDLNTIGASMVAVGSVITGAGLGGLGYGLLASTALIAGPQATAQLGNGIQAGLIAAQTGGDAWSAYRGGFYDATKTLAGGALAYSGLNAVLSTGGSLALNSINRDAESGQYEWDTTDQSLIQTFSGLGGPAGQLAAMGMRYDQDGTSHGFNWTTLSDNLSRPEFIAAEAAKIIVPMFLAESAADGATQSNSLTGQLMSLFGGIVGAFKDGFSGVYDAIASGIEGAVSFFGNLFDSIGGGLESIWNWITGGDPALRPEEAAGLPVGTTPSGDSYFYDAQRGIFLDAEGRVVFADGSPASLAQAGGSSGVPRYHARGAFTQTERGTEYRVESGDHLAPIVARAKAERGIEVSLEEMVALNNLESPHRIEVGQVLRFPSTGGFGQSVVAFFGRLFELNAQAADNYATASTGGDPRRSSSQNPEPGGILNWFSGLLENASRQRPQQSYSPAEVPPTGELPSGLELRRLSAPERYRWYSTVRGQNPSIGEVDDYLDELMDERPEEFRNVARAMLVKESTVQQFGRQNQRLSLGPNRDKNRGNIVVSTDVGIAQINDVAHRNQDFNLLARDWKENMRYGVEYLYSKWMRANSVHNLTGEERARAAYSMYNAGNRGWDRWRRTNDHRDSGFLNLLRSIQKDDAFPGRLR